LLLASRSSSQSSMPVIIRSGFCSRSKNQAMQLTGARIHTCNEHCTIPPICNVHKVEYKPQLAQKPRILRASRKGHESSINCNRPLKLHRNGPCRKIICEPALAARSKHKTEALKLLIPIPQLFAVGRLMFRRYRPDAKKVP